jgi:response regulator RpfG family c-di-GMP phosphodiesterase
MIGRILFVDDDPNILMAYKRQFRKQFNMDTAEGGDQALEMISSDEPYAVVVSDMRMPKMNGIELLQIVASKVPDTVRMILTGNSDQQTAIDAINEGHIFRFLTKPCPHETFAKALMAGLEQYRLITAERELLEKTLKSIVQVLTDILALVNPEFFGRTARLKRGIQELAVSMDLPEIWSMETAALLSQIGGVLLPEGVLQKIYSGKRLSEEERQIFEMQPSVASNLIRKIPRMEQIAAMIQYQEKNFDGTGTPYDSVSGEKIPIGARLLKAVLDFDTWESAGLGSEQALSRMQQNARKYDPKVLQTLKRIHGAETTTQVRCIMASELEEGMVLAEAAKTKQGAIVVARGQEVTGAVREVLTNFQRSGMLIEPLKIALDSSR